ncbi:fluoride efflux transporter CrcB [Rhodococcus sp. D2-41]|uniref:Fluoride-specific ion channel FluC n=1 Tax=Speluncibacter jeojiensis TaxID=2710754 RepID=A0A9X4RDZ6_9ACTN|nr:fluoride efflux transporter CrcB [Rhodococcus sp. D2-41]MDG3011528.1 fluoride efflux transporter CrcB [Rhodococcus sp. D2-41]MDG3015113.1 fluoride efflux transporter CrcB [Corynebacteriales bacterium D3-21]
MAGYDRRELAAIFVGGAVGTAARAALGTVLVSNPHGWPWSTFVVNIVGAALLGYFSTRLQERLPLSSYRRPMLGTGVCGGLTTFSTMQVETVLMLQHGEYLLASSYVVASVICGLLAVHLASSATRRVRVLA